MRRLVALAALALPLCACQATVRVGVAPKANGSGDLTVSLVLDKAAAGVVGDPAAALKTADLQKAGWVQDRPVTDRDGGSTTTLHHPFRTVEEADAILAGLAGGAPGTAAPFHIRLTHHSGHVSSTVAVAGDVDLSGGVDRFADDKLRQALGTPSLAALIDADRKSGAAIGRISAEVAAVMSGRPTHVAQGAKVEGTTAVWDVPLGARSVIGASSSARDGTTTKWLVAAGLLVAAAVVVGLVRFSRRNEWRFGDGRDVARPRDRRRPSGGRHRAHQDRWSMPTGPGSRR